MTKPYNELSTDGKHLIFHVAFSIEDRHGNPIDGMSTFFPCHVPVDPIKAASPRETLLQVYVERTIIAQMLHCYGIRWETETIIVNEEIDVDFIIHNRSTGEEYRFIQSITVEVPESAASVLITPYDEVCGKLDSQAREILMESITIVYDETYSTLLEDKG